MKLSRLTHAVILAGFAAGGAGTALAQQPGETVEGTLTHIELHDTPRHIKVRWSGGEAQQTIANRTHLVFDPSEVGYFPNQELSDLKPGMQVKFKYAEGALDRLYVQSVPANLRPRRQDADNRSDRAESRGGRSRELKVRILSMDGRRGEFKADVAGRRESFRAANPRALSRVEVGDLVVITVESQDGDEVVTDIRTAGSSGRVVRVDRRRGQVTLNVGGRQEDYRVDDKDLLEDIEEGDKIRFEFEDRPGGRKVITGVN